VKGKVGFLLQLLLYRSYALRCLFVLGACAWPDVSRCNLQLTRLATRNFHALTLQACAARTLLAS
jgi:hypothetical protein